MLILLLTVLHQCAVCVMLLGCFATTQLLT